ncbi:MAG TPA: hypothetical protein VMG32_02815 [Anaeromyxobacteraceae bacterium]|nr:hypothetical protein [Anaeromyxobacteraceae bacterium]
MRTVRVSLFAAALFAGGCASAPPPPPRPAVCELDRGAAAAPPDGQAFIALILRGIDPVTRRATSPALDCAGAQVRWDVPAISCDDGAVARTLMPDRAVSSDDVLTTATPSGDTLVWIPTARYTSGDALGPVALVEVTPTKLRVLALGPLRTFPSRARLHLEHLGEHEVLVAEGEYCTRPDPASCTRSARLVPLRGNRFVPEPLLHEDGTCASGASIDLSRRQTRQVEGRFERTELSATLSFEPSALSVEEQVVVADVGDQPNGTAQRVLHRAQSSRTIRWANAHLVVTGFPLWSRMVGSSSW